MQARSRGVVGIMAAVAVAVALAACGPGARTGSGRGNASTIGVLLPGDITARWETQDRPLLGRKIKELCDDCTVQYANAKSDVAVQQEQLDSMINRRLGAILLVAVDGRALGATVAKAAAADVPVIAFDRFAKGADRGLCLVRRRGGRQAPG
jgi:D-xylose transport system substrate-binding protein